MDYLSIQLTLRELEQSIRDMLVGDSFSYISVALYSSIKFSYVSRYFLSTLSTKSSHSKSCIPAFTEPLSRSIFWVSFYYNPSNRVTLPVPLVLAS